MWTKWPKSDRRCFNDSGVHWTPKWFKLLVSERCSRYCLIDFKTKMPKIIFCESNPTERPHLILCVCGDWCEKHLFHSNDKRCFYDGEKRNSFAKKCYIFLTYSEMGLLVHSKSKSYLDGLVQERRNSIANVLELRFSCTNPSSWLCPDSCSLQAHIGHEVNLYVLHVCSGKVR